MLGALFSVLLQVLQKDCPWRLILKKFFINAAHSSFITPFIVSTRCIGWGVSKRLTQLPCAPHLKSGAPQTKRLSREWIIAPAHMGQGSRVQYRVASRRRQLEITSAPCFKQSSSACAVALLSDSTRLCARATTSRSITRTAPTGTSPLANALSASAKASFMKLISFIGSFLKNFFPVMTGRGKIQFYMRRKSWDGRN